MHSASRDYQATVAQFVSLGAKLIRTPIAERYPELATLRHTRPLEPGFIPPDRPPRIVIASYYPNASDLNTAAYDRLRERFWKWGTDGTLAAYGTAYQDWIDSLPVIPFYQSKMLPVLEAIGVAATEIAWLPLVKVPLPARTAPDEDVIWTDREVLWEQLVALQPPIIWIQGQKVYETIGEQAERITEKFVVQKLHQMQTKAAREGELGTLTAKLTLPQTAGCLKQHRVPQDSTRRSPVLPNAKVATVRGAAETPNYFGGRTGHTHQARLGSGSSLSTGRRCV